MAWQKGQKYLHRKYALQLLLRLHRLLRGYRSLVTVPFPFADVSDGSDSSSSASDTFSSAPPAGADSDSNSNGSKTLLAKQQRFNVCGDTHGQYYDTLNIFGGCLVVWFRAGQCKPSTSRWSAVLVYCGPSTRAVLVYAHLISLRPCVT